MRRGFGVFFVVAPRVGIADRWARFGTFGGFVMRPVKMTLERPHFRANPSRVLEPGMASVVGGRLSLDAGSAFVLVEVSL